MRALVAIPNGPERRVAIVRRAAVSLAALLLLAELAVAVRFSGTVGGLLMVTTGGLAAFAVRGFDTLSVARPRSDEDVVPTVDRETNLPTRVQLIDTLSRDIASSERYGHSLTLSVVRISQYAETKASWGAGTARQAIDHVSETLRRITRSSDFVARLDESTFAVILLQCSGRQAALYGDRLSLAVSNRPLKSSSNVKVPLYVGVDVSSLEYDSTRFRGPLEFLSLAGGDVMMDRPRMSVGSGPRGQLAADPRSMRQQLVKDYYPGGEAKDFAEAYKEARSRNRHAG